MECSKCKQQLKPDGILDRYICISCKKDFCVNEGSILKEINELDFFCFDCQQAQKIALARIKQKRAEEQAKELQRRTEWELAREAEKAELARRQSFHNDNSLEASGQETTALPNFNKIDNVKIGFWGERKLCSGYIMRYGWVGAIPTRIYLTFNHLENQREQNDLYETNYTNYKVNYIPVNQIKSFCARCSKEIISNWFNTVNYDYYARKEQMEKGLIEAKNRIKERDKDLSQ